MDKKPYYRLLGLTEGATAAQIKDAYEKKMHKLRFAAAATKKTAPKGSRL